MKVLHSVIKAITGNGGGEKNIAQRSSLTVGIPAIVTMFVFGEIDWKVALIGSGILLAYTVVAQILSPSVSAKKLPDGHIIKPKPPEGYEWRLAPKKAE